ncbi:MAG: M14 family metallocarboxypeptidase [Clostridia bacterium]|nr:M14 family metallocarboxypeptidase [Clostridia bacterium]
MEERIVRTNINYTYNVLMEDLINLRARYPILSWRYYGRSVMGKQLPYIRIGNGQRQVFYSAGIHANEWINSIVMMKFIEDFCIAYENDAEIFGYSARKIYENSSIFIAPMCNPDGIDLVLGNISENSVYYLRAREIAERYPDIPFPDGWKANINGVDLNLQFPANWLLARENKYAQGFTTPAPRDFVGFGPLTEPEALALYDFTLMRNFRIILSYHTQGEVIFWRYLDYEPSGAEDLGEEFARISGYELDDTIETGSYAGYRDWFISTYDRPGYTIETGKGINPLPLSQFEQIYNENLGILVTGAAYR